MLRRLSATPCPVNDLQRSESRRDSIVSNDNDTTANLDYTTEFKALFRNTKPRRRPTATLKSHGAPLGFTIHEDEELKLDNPPFHPNMAHQPPRTSIISQPAQRPKRRVSFVSPQPLEATSALATDSRPRISAAPRRLSLGPSKPSVEPGQEETLPRIPSPKISKPARRGTIYIPNDDTTMPSAYMGIFSPLKTSAGGDKEAEATEITGLAAQMAMKKSSRKSILAVSPKRTALLPNSKPLQTTAVHLDRAGSGAGKENMPPGHHPSKTQFPPKKARKSEAPSRPSSQHPVDAPASSRLFTQTASSMARSKDKGEASNSLIRPVWNSGVASKPRARHSIAVAAQIPSRPISHEVSDPSLHKLRVPTRFVIPDIGHKTTLSTFPLLEEGVADASMYEEGWLGQQEVAITQLVNNLFQASTPSYGERRDHQFLRVKLLEVYGNSEMVLLHKRVHGALLYGALGISKDNIEYGQRVRSDIGHRKTFIDLWLKTYEADLLLTALEVVVGRRLHTTSGRNSGTRSPPSSPTAVRHTLRRAIETLLVQNEDGTSEMLGPETSVWSVQRTLLRSLMLIKVLDELKVHSRLPPVGNLFQTTSPHKTSTSVVRQLIRLMNPSVGDAIRALNHLGYSVSHSQYPLEEYSYEIENLAVDLRDGIRLTRLVELLLYRSASPGLSHHHDTDATMTLAMPTGEILSLTEGQHDWPLSQHLKVPCLGHATKEFNNQIALTALQRVNGMAPLLQDISATDLVDGYREKTVRLLWALTSKWGLGGLVDWADLTREIKRLGRLQGRVGDWASNELDIDDEDPEYMRCKSMLKMWVKAVAGAHGMAVRNFTTSFADGRVFQTIIDEYSPYLAGLDKVEKNIDLAGKLRIIGCSAEFTKLFERRSGGAQEHVFDRDFVLASVAFLCSRLLGPSRQARAATVVQRAWRGHWSKVLSARKQVLQGLAASCAAKVQSTWSEVEAKAVIWRAWKAYQQRQRMQIDSRCAVTLPDALSALSVGDDASDIWLSLR